MAPARCQLYLVAPAELPPDFAETLAALLEAAEIACLRLPPRPGMAHLVRLAQGRGTAVVIEGDPDLAAALGADGVHLPDLKTYGAARNRLGHDDKRKSGKWVRSAPSEGASRDCARPPLRRRGHATRPRPER